MKVIVGLGNPGNKYENTRHNVGFMIADRLRSTDYGFSDWRFEKKFDAEVSSQRAERLLLAKPQTFMNRSGEAVKKLAKSYKPKANSLYVVHDDLDIPLGKYKIQLGKGPKVHNGLQSIYKALGTKEFWHVRVGIDNRGGVLRLSGLSPFDKAQGRHKSRRAQDDTAALKSLAAVSSGEEYVLGRFLPEEREIIERVIGEVVERLLLEMNLRG